MIPGKKKQSREEILQRKREAERERYKRIKNDPQKYEETKRKWREIYLRKKQKGTRKDVKDMTLKEHREAKNRWNKYNRRRLKKKRDA